MKEITITVELFDKLLDSLESMTGYADDGIISRGDPDYKDFFEAIDESYRIMDEAANVRNEFFEKYNSGIKDLDELSKKLGGE